jgi:hypothetical protein
MFGCVVAKFIWGVVSVDSCNWILAVKGKREQKLLATGFDAIFGCFGKL